MSEARFEEGHFAWCRFPQREQPDAPGPGEHVVYIFAVIDETDGGETIVGFYTTSQPVPESKVGTVSIDIDAARSLGQTKVFTIDASQVGFMPRHPAFFPRGAGETVLPGRATKTLRDSVTKALNEAIKRKLTETLGPRRPDRPATRASRSRYDRGDGFGSR